MPVSGFGPKFHHVPQAHTRLLQTTPFVNVLDQTLGKGFAGLLSRHRSVLWPRTRTERSSLGKESEQKQSACKPSTIQCKNDIDNAEESQIERKKDRRIPFRRGRNWQVRKMGPQKKKLWLDFNHTSTYRNLFLGETNYRIEAWWLWAKKKLRLDEAGKSCSFLKA